MRFLKISLLVVTAASTLHAQESKSKFGLGVTFNPGALTIPVSSTSPFRTAWNQAVMTCQRGATVRS